MSGDQLAGSTLALCVGDLPFSLMLFADGVSLAVPLRAVLVSSCPPALHTALPLPLLFWGEGPSRAGGEDRDCSHAAG